MLYLLIQISLRPYLNGLYYHSKSRPRFFFRQTVQIAHEVSIEQQNSTKLPLAVKKGALVDQVSNT